MKNSWKVAKWELKRNMKNKSFIISLFLTPVLFLLFSTLPSLLEKLESAPEPVTVYVQDELQLWDEIEVLIQTEELNWVLEEAADEEQVMKIVEDSSYAAYIPLTKESLSTGILRVYTSEEMGNQFFQQVRLFEEPLRNIQLANLPLTTEQIELISRGVAVESVTVTPETEGNQATNTADHFKRIVPSAFAGIILFSIVVTGMMIFQSASQEKKEKVAEIILSSVTPGELMNGKIIGYFSLGMIQVIVWLLFIIPIVIGRFDFPVFDYLLVPETSLLLFIAFAGYLLFAAIFVGMGATVEDMTATSNFQGMVMMLPFLPLVFIGPVLSDPSGLIAQIGTYVPVTAPAILLIRLAVLEEWPWTEILIAIAILLISIWIFMKIAGKIFKTGILMYGKNATPQEILKWLRQ